jgi:hypothetical protein
MRFPPEFQLLSLSAQLRPRAARLRELAGTGVDWQAFLDLAERHRVRPLVYKNLTKACWDLVPADMQQQWQRNARAIGRRALRVTGALLKIAALFEKEQIPVVALKGPVLAQEVYGSTTLREFVDLDLLVRERDFLKAVTTLQRLNYRADWDVDPCTQLQFLRYQGETSFAKAKSGLIIDLHWRVAAENNALPLDAAFFWPRFRPVQFEGQRLLGFAPEDLALYLAAQGGHDEWSDFRRLCDLAALIHRHPHLEWDSVVQEANRLHGLRVLLLGLRLAAELLDVPLPEIVENRMREDSTLSALANQSLAKITARNPPDDFRRSLFQIQVKERLWDKTRLAFGLLTDRTDTDGQWIMLPKAIWPLYRALRPLRQLIKVMRGYWLLRQRIAVTSAMSKECSASPQRG